jgi:hypothetical protein
MGSVFRAIYIHIGAALRSCDWLRGAAGAGTWRQRGGADSKSPPPSLRCFPVPPHSTLFRLVLSQLVYYVRSVPVPWIKLPIFLGHGSTLPVLILVFGSGSVRIRHFLQDQDFEVMDPVPKLDFNIIKNRHKTSNLL